MKERKKQQPEEEKPLDDIIFLGEEPEIQEVAQPLDTTRIYRVPIEANIKRNSNLMFPHHRIKNLGKKRIFRLGGGDLIVIPSVDEKAPTTASLRFFLAFLYLGYIKKCPGNKVPFSSRELAKVLRRSWNGEFARQIYREMRSLAMTTFEWRQSFETKTGTRTSIANFHLINAFNYEEYRERLERETTVSYREFQFKASYEVEINSAVWNSVKNGNISFANLETLLSFKSGIAEVFYLRIDTILCSREYATKPIELRSDTIIKALQLDNVTIYKKVSRKKITLEKIVKECNGKILSNGGTLKVELLPTADGQDWKLKCSKAKPKNDPTLKVLPPAANTDPDQVEYLADQITEATGQPEHRHWHVLIAKHYPQHFIARALSELRQEPPENMRDKGAVFTAKFKAIVTGAGLPWLKSEKKEPA
jgi:hypothetical protein